ncbi:hypothetical protein ABZU75_15730 [Streptosporangium sp. NPDC005286]
MIRRSDNGNWAVPGGAIHLGDSAESTLLALAEWIAGHRTR